MNNKHKLCLTVPYRDRENHMKQFIPAMHRTLTEQNIDYVIIIVEQEPDTPFNRAKLLNVGFDIKKDECDYFVYHDVDMIPVISDYSYCPNPTHLAAEAEQFGYMLPNNGTYVQYFGGVTLFDRESFMKINGYSNQFEKWGAEDDEIYNRCVTMNIPRSRKNCRYRSLAHERPIDPVFYQKNLERLNKYMDYFDGKTFIEGLTTLEYKILSTENIDEKTTKITVSI